MSKALQDAIAERERQKSVEGFTAAGDDQYQRDELPHAAAAYAVPGLAHSIWPFHQSWFKLGTVRENYIKAIALLLAEVERIDRLENKDESTN